MTAPQQTVAVLIAAGVLLTAACSGDSDDTRDMILATTTSTQDSGLLDAILPAFEEGSDCVPKTVAVGSGQAMTMGENGDADVLLVHSPRAEEDFMTAGHGSSREAVMHNDFVLVGPPGDPAGLRATDDAAAAMSRIASREAGFASRADGSGTHAKEMGLWDRAGITPSGAWYVETGQGMGQTLTIASQKQAYTLADRGTFLSAENLDSEIAFEDTPDLQNPYHMIVVEADGDTNTACAEEFSQWIRSESVQRMIAEFGTEQYGQPLFFPDAQAQE